MTTIDRPDLADTITPDQRRALDVAATLVAAGVPLFVAPPDPDSPTGFRLPRRWETSTPTPDVVNRWRPGWALCAVMGHRLDLVDVDPRNGGDVSATALRQAGMWPRSYAKATTPSGGWHEFVAPLRAGCRDGVVDGIDVKGGNPDGTGRGFAFIAPTVRTSKTTGHPVAYRWIVEPNLDALGEDDDTGEQLAERVRLAKGNRQAATANELLMRDDPAERHAGPIPDGKRHAALISYAGRLRSHGLTSAEALVLFRRRWEDCAQPPAARFPLEWDEALDKLRDVYQRYAPPEEGSDDERGAEEDRAAGAVLAEAQRLRVQREAKRIVDAEQRPPVALPEVLTLRQRLARPPQAVAWRIESLHPVDARIVLAAQFKAGKTTTVGNLARSLVDGDPFLDRYDVAPIGGRLALIDFEMSGRQLDEWLRDQRIVNDDQVVVFPLRGSASAFDLLDPLTRQRWARKLRELDVAYVLWDCLRPVVDALGLDEHRDAGRLLTGFDALLSEAGVGEATIVHHMGHTGERSRGDSRIRDWPDVEWRLVRQDDDPASPRFLSAYGRDVDVPESQLTFDPASRRLAIQGGSRKDAAAVAALADVLGLLEEQPRLSGRAIEEALIERTEHTQKAIRAAIKIGVRDGRIATETGARRAILHSKCVSALQCVSSASTQSSECVSASIEDALHSDTTRSRSASTHQPNPDCPCGRRVHSPGDWGTCRICGTRHHQNGPGRQPCPTCTLKGAAA